MWSVGCMLTLLGPDGSSLAPVQPGPPSFFLETVIPCTVSGVSCRNNLWFIKIINCALLLGLFPGQYTRFITFVLARRACGSKGFSALGPLAYFGGEQGLRRTLAGQLAAHVQYRGRNSKNQLFNEHPQNPSLQFTDCSHIHLLKENKYSSLYWQCTL